MKVGRTASTMVAMTVLRSAGKKAGSKADLRDVMTAGLSGTRRAATTAHKTAAQTEHSTVAWTDEMKVATRETARAVSTAATTAGSKE
jgi:hypothetical protein